MDEGLHVSFRQKAWNHSVTAVLKSYYSTKRSRSKYAYQLYFMLSFSLPVSVFLKKTSFVLPVAVIHPSLYIFSLIQIALSSASVFQLIRSKSKVVNPFWNS